ncbi:MAG: sigma-70 family RNA polymerase sigma factor [Bryobacteraceae bacterium]
MLFSKQPRTDEFEKVALPHLPELYRAAGRLLGDSTRAEDVVQEVYLQAWKSFDRFESGTNCRAWLFKILVNTAHHYRRKWFNVRMVKESEEVLEQAVAGAPPIPEQVTEQEIVRALDRIPADYREVVLLADVEDFSYKEIAGMLNVPIGTVMSRISRGRKLLREYLADVARSYGIGTTGEEGRSA